MWEFLKSAAYPPLMNIYLVKQIAISGIDESESRQTIKYYWGNRSKVTFQKKFF